MPILLRFVISVIAKTFSKLFSLATVTFLGRVPSRDDSKISFIGVLSLYWLFLFISLFSPYLASIVVPFVPNDPILIQFASICALVAIPIVVGWVTLKMETMIEGKLPSRNS
ncbi:MAG TPA: hypothetical protein VFK27_03285 [Bacillales bacterium]|nr:hypothetical protein [Bacillales bacterium]